MSKKIFVSVIGLSVALGVCSATDAQQRQATKKQCCSFVTTVLFQGWAARNSMPDHDQSDVCLRPSDVVSQVARLDHAQAMQESVRDDNFVATASIRNL